jgi:exosome complex component RRP4
MTVTFVPPRTLIHGTGPITISSANNTLPGEAVEMQDFYDEDMDIDIDEHGAGSLLTKKLVVPGQLVTDDPQFMRYHQSKFSFEVDCSLSSGHGTYIGEDEKVIASVAGTVIRVNKLLSVKSLKFRYLPLNQNSNFADTSPR